eukprot:TRINITY_DN12500_c1_g2_i1.p3 TRINITY_DN12500_c1_g2~~TRINITY_DN12500_c1_g2_i1.p3  ORF type:complete len:194 (-),score=1.12 TRINITY_DN12500_c1_g2_i1:942-1523(-)
MPSMILSQAQAQIQKKILISQQICKYFVLLEFNSGRKFEKLMFFLNLSLGLNLKIMHLLEFMPEQILFYKSLEFLEFARGVNLRKPSNHFPKNLNIEVVHVQVWRGNQFLFVQSPSFENHNKYFQLKLIFIIIFISGNNYYLLEWSPSLVGSRQEGLEEIYETYCQNIFFNKIVVNQQVLLICCRFCFIGRLC